MSGSRLRNAARLQMWEIVAFNHVEPERNDDV